MKTLLLALAAASALTLATPCVFAAVPVDVRAALADPGRPAADVARDMARKPAPLVDFAGIKPGDTVIDFIPGGGYFTRIFSGVVGPTGHVYATVPKVAEAMEAKDTATIATFAATHPNVTVFVPAAGGFTPPSGLADVFWTAQNYHDLYNPMSKGAPPANLLPINKAVFAALKPGGIYIVIDHVAPADSGVSDTRTLHRIDPAVVKKDVLAAGFEFVGESDVLKNPADPHDKIVFDPSIRGHTDQFVYKFRKPKV